MFKSGIYNLVAGLTRLGVSLLSLPLLIQLLGTTSFGLFSIINSVVAFVALAEGSIALATTVFVTKEIQPEGRLTTRYQLVSEACFSATALLATAFFVILYTLAPLLADLYEEYGNANLVIINESLKLSSVVLFLRILQQYFIGILQAHHQYGLYNSSFTVYFVLTIVGNVVLAWFGYSIQLLFLWQIILTLLSLIFYTIICYRRGYVIRIFPSIHFRNSLLRDVLIYCSRTWPGTIGGLLFTQGDKLIVGKMLGLEMAGIYTALTNITYQINIHSATPVQPIVAYLKPSTDQSTHKKAYEGSHPIIEKSIFSNAMIVLFLGLILILFSTEVVEYFLRLKALKSLNLPLLLSSLALIYAIYSMNAVGYFTLFAIHKETINTTIAVSSSIITISLIYFGTKLYGLPGAIWGNAGYFVSLVQLPIAFRFIQYRFKTSRSLYIIVAILLTTSYLTVLIELSLPLRIIIFLLCITVALLNSRSYINLLLTSIMRRYERT